MSKEENIKVSQLSYLGNFKCLMDKCPDTCCSQWTINVDEISKALYEKEAPEIAKEVEPNDGDEYRMRRVENGDCVQLIGGLCQVQKNHGEMFLPDICHSFPRTYKKFGEETYMVANLACPESLRVGLYSTSPDDFSSWQTIYKNRTKSGSYDLKNDSLENLGDEELIDLYNSITKLVDDPNFSADEALARLLMVAQQLDKNEASHWPLIKSRIFDLTKKEKVLEIAQEEIDLPAEITNLLGAMCNLVNRDRPRYNLILGIVKLYLGSDKDSSYHIQENYQKLKTRWLENGDDKKYDHLLKNLLKTILSHKMFPIGSYLEKDTTLWLILLWNSWQSKLL